MNTAEATDQARKGPQLRLWLLIAVALALVLAANAHLVYVATMSQPACVAHVRQGEAGARPESFSAAQSSCSPPSSPQRQGAPS